jgi:DNA repair protein RAD5
VSSVKELLEFQTYRTPKIEDTIEGRILQIQKRKNAIVKEAFKGKSQEGDPESLENFKIIFED